MYVSILIGLATIVILFRRSAPIINIRQTKFFITHYFKYININQIKILKLNCKNDKLFFHYALATFRSCEVKNYGRLTYE